MFFRKTIMIRRSMRADPHNWINPKITHSIFIQIDFFIYR